LHSSSKTPANGVFLIEAMYLFYLTSRHQPGVFSFESIRWTFALRHSSGLWHITSVT
jgi:hypothetical protein